VEGYPGFECDRNGAAGEIAVLQHGCCGLSSAMFLQAPHAASRARVGSLQLLRFATGVARGPLNFVNFVNFRMHLRVVASGGAAAIQLHGRIASLGSQ